MRIEDAIRRRSEILRAILGEHTDYPLRVDICGLVCKGCSATVTAPTIDALIASGLTDDWAIADDPYEPDFCPGCKVDG